MERVPVSSCHLLSVGYDKQSKLLEVEFFSTSVYQYFDVPNETFEALLQADSKGRYFEANIKRNYRFQRVD